MHKHLKTQYEYLEEAKVLGLDFYRNLPEDQPLRERLIQKYKNGYRTMQLLENPQEEAGLLKAEILAFLPDFVPLADAFQLFQCEVWSNFASLLPSSPVADRNGLPAYYADYFLFLMRYQYKSLWFVSEKYKAHDLQEILAVERYCLLKRLEHIFKGYHEDLEFLVKTQDKLYLSLVKSVYTLDFLQIPINTTFVDGEKEIDDAKKTKQNNAYLTTVWLENDNWLAYHAENLQGAFAKLLQERLATFQFEEDYTQKNALTQKAVSRHDLQVYLRHYKKTNKLKKYMKIKTTLQMQSGEFSIKVSSSRFWWRAIGGVLLVGFLPIMFLTDILGKEVAVVLGMFVLMVGVVVLAASDDSKLPDED